MYGNDVEQPISDGSKGLGKKIIQKGRRMKKERKLRKQKGKHGQILFQMWEAIIW